MTIQFRKPEPPKQFRLRLGAGPYIMRFCRITEAPEDQWGEHLYWYWKLYNTVDDEETGKTKVIIAQLNEDGTDFEWRERTSPKFGKNPKSGIMSAARERVEALLKNDNLTADQIDEIASDPNAALADKYAFGYFTIKTNDDGRSFLNLQAIEPYRRGMLAPIQRVEDSDSTDDELPFDGGDDNDDGLPS